MPGPNAPESSLDIGSDRPPHRQSHPPAASMLHRSSSLGEESCTDHHHADTSPWRRGRKRLHLSNSASSESLPTASAEPLLTFGVIADVQYAPIPDGFSFHGVPRYYRHALSAARHAADHFQRDAVSLVVNLGDIIDGKCQEIEENGGESKGEDVDPGHEAVDEVVDALSSYSHGPYLHTYGNHELYNLNREDIGRKLGIPFVREPCGDLVGYRSHVAANTKQNGAIVPGLRFVIIDTYDLATMQRCPQTSRKRKDAEAILAKHNPNFPDLENSPEGLEDEQKRFVAFNGGIDRPQLDWLRRTLSEAKENGERVIVLSHQPILPGSSSPVCLVWNYDDVLTILREYSSTVIASFAGHAHKGGYKRDDESGIHFRVFEAVLESKDPNKTYGFVDVHEDRLVVRGLGDCTSAVYDYEHMHPCEDDDDLDVDGTNGDEAGVDCGASKVSAVL